ncbi:MAG: hypothetical protein PVS2B2_23770 [Candidatus Acidiferrum sp.]
MKYTATIAAIFLFATPSRAQSGPASQQSESPWAQDLKKYPGLLAEFGQLIDKLQHNIKFPAPRGASQIASLLPEGTMSYAAFPNYGDVAQQALKVFREELKESSVLRDWWEHGEVAVTGPKVEASLEKLSQLHQYLGEEIVVSGAMEGREPNLLVIAEIRRPGLKKFLQQLVNPLGGNSKPEMRVLDLQELAAAKDEGPSQKLIVLVRSDFVVGAFDLATLRSFNTRLERGSREFVSSPFGQRVVREYQGGVTILAAADLHTMLKQSSPGAEQNPTFLHSGFADMKYLVWEHKSVEGQIVSQSELSFSAPRHGAASWLAKAGPLSSLDFVSPKAILSSTVVFTDPAQIYEDLKELLSTSNSNPFAALAQMEQVLKLSLKDDLFGHLAGEITVELDNVAPPAPVWKVILKVKDTGQVQQTLRTLLTAAHFEAQHFDKGGITYYTVRIPSPKTSLEIGYAFADGHLIVASSPEMVAEAVRLHGSGGSLGKSKKFQASLPPGHSMNFSAMLYEDPVAMSALKMRQLAPEIAESLAQFSGEDAPSVVCVYGEETAIREASKGGAFDMGAALIVAAIAIPNLLRSKIAANEASAVGMMRTVNTAEVEYAATYPQRGFAPDMSTLGPNAREPGAESADHASLIDDTLGNESCTAMSWCTKSGYRFRVTANCKQQLCGEYVAIGTPVDSNTGGKSFCTTSDGVIRSITGPPLTLPVSVSECKAWSPLQ